MPVYPLDWQPPIKTGRYPHMAKHDARIWEAFLDQYGGNFLAISYDVALGGSVLPGDSLPEDERLGWQYSTAFKIDAVAQQENQVWIIEVKPGASASAIGQALCYTILAEDDSLSPLPLIPTVVTDRASADIKRCAEALGVQLITLPEAG
ncbi:MAG: hypothetical protein ACRD0K_19390 [Egibacteraceae bacterium]